MLCCIRLPFPFAYVGLGAPDCFRSSPAKQRRIHGQPPTLPGPVIYCTDSDQRPVVSFGRTSMSNSKYNATEVLNAIFELTQYSIRWLYVRGHCQRRNYVTKTDRRHATVVRQTRSQRTRYAYKYHNIELDYVHDNCRFGLMISKTNRTALIVWITQRYIRTIENEIQASKNRIINEPLFLFLCSQQIKRAFRRYCETRSTTASKTLL